MNSIGNFFLRSAISALALTAPPLVSGATAVDFIMYVKSQNIRISKALGSTVELTQGQIQATRVVNEHDFTVAEGVTVALSGYLKDNGSMCFQYVSYAVPVFNLDKDLIGVNYQIDDVCWMAQEKVPVGVINVSVNGITWQQVVYE